MGDGSEALLYASRLLAIECACRLELLADGMAVLCSSITEVHTGLADIHVGLIDDEESLAGARSFIAAELEKLLDQDGNPEELFRIYCDHQSTTLNLVDSRLNDIYEDFICFAERLTDTTHWRLADSPSSRLASAMALTRAFPAAPVAYAQLMAPLYYLSFAPFAPLSSGHLIPQLVQEIVADRGMASMEDILSDLEDGGVFCTFEYLSAVCYAHSSLICCRQGGDTVVGMIDQILPKFKLAAFNLDERNFCHWYRQSAVLVEEVGFDEVIEVSLDPSFLKLFHCRHGFDDTALNVDWFEVVAKTVIVQRELTQIRVQDIDASLHEAIVLELLKSGRAMPIAELVRNIGVPIKLDPELLGPGRVVAYSRHPRFLQPDSAYYVLFDWVETDSEKKNRIARDRIVTPLRAKAWEFTLHDLMKLCKDDELVRRFAIFQPVRIAGVIARQLPDKPIELYYLNKIRKLARQLLEENGVDLGHEHFILADALQFDMRVQDKFNFRRIYFGEKLGLGPFCIGDAADLDRHLIEGISSSIEDNEIAVGLISLLRIGPIEVPTVKTESR